MTTQNLWDASKAANPKINRRKKIIKIRAEVDEKEMKGTIGKINKTKAGSLKR